MKNKISALLLCAAVIIIAGACSINNTGTDPDADTGTAVQTETGENKKSPSAGKVLLKLRKFDILSESEIVNPALAETADFAEKECSFDGTVPSEAERHFYTKTEDTEPLTDYITAEFGIEIDENWLCTVHYYNSEKTDGMVQFVYTIDKQIKTNRAVTFYIENAAIKRLTHSYLDARADEKNLLAAKAEFENTYEQEKINPLGDGWSITDETTDYVYNYKTEKLKYTFNLFLTEAESGIINNDYGTEVVIF